LICFGFGFISLKLKKPNQIQTEKNKKKLSQTVFCPKKPNRTETDRFKPVSVWFRFFLKKFNLIIFFIKIKPNQKKSTLLFKVLYQLLFTELLL